MVEQPSAAELRSLLHDCLALWSVEGRIEVDDTGIRITTSDGTFHVQRAAPDMRPVHWLLHRPDGRTRVAPSIVALLSALRNAFGVHSGNRLRIGAR